VVDGNDLTIILGGWGSCNQFMLMGGGEGGGLTPEALQEMFGFEDLESFTAWLESLDFGAMTSILSLLIDE